MNKMPFQYKEKQEWINWFTFLVGILPDDLSQKGAIEINKLFCSDFCQEEFTIIDTNLSEFQLRDKLNELLKENKDISLKDFIKKATLINKRGYLVSNSFPNYNHERRKGFIDFLRSQFDFIESGDKFIIVSKNSEGKERMTILRNLSKIESISHPHFWKLINNCKKDNECKLAFCQKCNPEFKTLFSEQQRKQIHEILTNSPSEENDAIRDPKVSSDYVLKMFFKKFKDSCKDYRIIVHWDWIIIFDNPQAKYEIMNFLVM
ncbi:MAG: hypothetical protein mread185_000113 [Mycoplasmataceae bacterium]|nr:MAG: hypothetical protein mread185_000113 [Mycoplasmataceae bacterium]